MQTGFTKKANRQYLNNRSNIERRQNYLIEKRKYKKAIYKAKKIAQEYKLNQLADLEKSDPSKFWAVLKCLFVEIPNSQFAEYVNSSLSTIEGVPIPNRDLNIRILQEELDGVMRELNSGKATYLDEISNDFINSASRTLSTLLHLFNTIIRLCDFPTEWGGGLIIPIHKKDDRLSVENYRVITISSCRGKVFVKILTQRIDGFMQSSLANGK